MQVKFEEGRFLKDFSTFGIGGEARFLAEVKTIEEMQEALRFCSEKNLKFIVIGKGSNSLFDDRGFDGLVIINKINFCRFENTEVEVGAGYSFALLGVQTARRGLSGLEFASGIPGSVGGAIYMNAGASGHQTCDMLQRVQFVDEKGQLHSFSKQELSFAYRHSSFQKMKGAIVAATFLLGFSPEARKKQLEIVDYRTRTQPYGEMSCGCIFRNPEGASAGLLIEKCGLKGMKIGGAEVSVMHANFIINTGSATTADILTLAQLVKSKVLAHSGHQLEMELCVIPFQG